jgi:transposase InsO family protein
MSQLKTFSQNDRAIFEGLEVKTVTPLIDNVSKEATHYAITVHDDEAGAIVRKFRVAEIAHLIESERLVIFRNYYCVTQQIARQTHGNRCLAGLSKKRRDKIDAITFLGSRMDHYRTQGMKLTPQSVAEFRNHLAEDYGMYQARVTYGTDKPNSTQLLRPLPKLQSLLKYSRDFRNSKGNPLALDRKAKRPRDLANQDYSDKELVLSWLADFACTTSPSYSEIAEKARDEIQKHNEFRKQTGWDYFIPVFSVRTYERWIEKYLPPFDTTMQRHGHAAAVRKCRITEIPQSASVPGYKVIYDAWQVHISTLDTTRAAWLAMTDEERSSVKRIRRWIIVAIDSATRCILGFSICAAPNEQSTLEAMRSCYMDKTYLLRNAGITTGTWNFLVRHSQTVVDNGSEFGRHPFGGARFTEALRIFGGSLMHTTAGVSELRAQVERLFRTTDQRFARKIPGWTTGSVATLGDRKPATNACLTDDDLQNAFVGYVAEYHATKHRGLGDRPPAAVWKEMAELPEFDNTIPGPAQLRQACGFFANVGISDRGIRFEHNSYSNAFIRKQRMAPAAERIDYNSRAIEAIIDPFDLGGITIFENGEPISVPCTAADMCGKSLREWKAECHLKKSRAKQDCADFDGRRRDANNAWTEQVARSARVADVGMGGYTQREIERAALELSFGKGQHEMPFIGRDEYVDPMEKGCFGESVDDPEPSHLDIASDEPGMIDAPSAMDRFRKSVRPISPRKSRS